MLELRNISPLLQILPACMLEHLSHNTKHGCGMTSHIIITTLICIQAVSAIMVWSMIMCNYVLTN